MFTCLRFWLLAISMLFLGIYFGPVFSLISPLGLAIIMVWFKGMDPCDGDECEICESVTDSWVGELGRYCASYLDLIYYCCERDSCGAGCCYCAAGVPLVGATTVSYYIMFAACLVIVAMTSLSMMFSNLLLVIYSVAMGANADAFLFENVLRFALSIFYGLSAITHPNAVKSGFRNTVFFACTLIEIPSIYYRYRQIQEYATSEDDDAANLGNKDEEVYPDIPGGTSSPGEPMKGMTE